MNADYVTHLTREEFIKLYPEIDIPELGKDSYPIVVAIHTNYPTDTYFSRELGTKPYVIVKKAVHAYSPRNYWSVEKVVDVGEENIVNIPKNETSRIYFVRGTN